ncbi:hypothetical protein KJ359_000529 [Pestalotiopsis sp. 9143b]|nr:hypothetical protein KJ359_000529 [Pestalotiopsis sp. 9143b]
MSSSTTVPDRGIETLGVIWSLTGASGIILVLRVYCKFSRHRGLWWDDYILILAWLNLLAPTAVTTREISLGFGRHVGDIAPQNLGELGFLGQLTAFFSILGALWSKTSFAITMLRITNGWAKYAVWAFMISSNVFMLISAVFTWTWCTPVSKIWLMDMVPGTCWDHRVVVQYNTFSGALLPWTIIPKLQMRTREKFGVAVAMSMGVFAGITGFVKCWKLQALASGDFTWDGVDLVEWGAAETAVTVIATSIPILRALFSELRSTARSNSKGTGKDAMPGSQSRFSRMSKTPAVVVNARARPVSQQELNEGDSDSDRSIWPGGKPYIMKTDEITLTYDERRGDEENGYEMDVVSPTHVPKR